MSLRGFRLSVLFTVSGHSCWWHACHTVHAGLSEFRPDVMILVKRQGFIDFVNASASIRPFSIHHNSSPQGEYSRLLFWPFPVHKDCLNAASSIPSLLSWTFLGTSAFDQAHAVRHPNVLHLHLALLVPVCHRHQFACVISHGTHLRRSPCSTALWSAYDSACSDLHTRFSVDEANPITWMLWSSPSGAKPWTDNEPCPAGIWIQAHLQKTQRCTSPLQDPSSQSNWPCTPASSFGSGVPARQPCLPALGLTPWPLDCRVSGVHSPCMPSLHDSIVLPMPATPSLIGDLSIPFPWRHPFPYGTCQSGLAWSLECFPQHRFLL